jgi:hypothetical protein
MSDDAPALRRVVEEILATGRFALPDVEPICRALMAAWQERDQARVALAEVLTDLLEVRRALEEGLGLSLPPWDIPALRRDEERR